MNSGPFGRVRRLLLGRIPADDVDTVRRASVLILVCLLVTGSSTALALGETTRGELRPSLVLGLTALAGVVPLLVLRQTGSVVIAGSGVAGLVFAANTAMMALSGPSAPSIVAYAISPMLAFSLAGSQAGRIWALVALAAGGVTAVLWASGTATTGAGLGPMEQGVSALVVGSAIVMIADFIDRSQHQVLDAVIAARAAAEEASAAKTRFLANMSHELRTPMHGVIGMTSLLLSTRRSPQDREALEIIQRSALGLVDVVDDILTYAKLEGGYAVSAEAPFEPLGLLLDAVTLQEVSAHQKGLTLEVEVEAGLPRRLVGGARSVRQVVNNLIGNAVKFTEEGGVVVRSGFDGDHLVIAVADTGPGISEEVRRTLFRPFALGDDSHTRKHGGSGLGLAISRRLCELCGGTLGVERRLGGGAVFTATFRVGQVDPAPSG